MGAEHRIQHPTPTADPERPGPSPVEAADRWPETAGAVATVARAGRPMSLPPPHSPIGRATILALQHAAGNAFVGRLLADRPAVPAQTVQRGPGDWIKDKLGLRENEAELDAYEDAIEERDEFKGKVHKPDGAGEFPNYTPAEGKLRLEIKCAITFVDGEKTELDPPRPKDPNAPWAPTLKKIPIRWTEAEKAAWKQKFFGQTSEFWSGKHTFWCQKDWWEELKATAEVRFVEGRDEANQTATEVPRFRISVYKERVDVPKFLSHVKMASVHLAKEDVDPDTQAKGATVAQHEAGHMLGLGDEYAEPGMAEGERASHSDLVKAEFGHEVIRGKVPAESIMANGAKVLPEHGVKFLETLKKATKMTEWGHEPKKPRPKPSGGDLRFSGGADPKDSPVFGEPGGPLGPMPGP